MPSAPIIAVVSSSSLMSALPSMAFIAFFADLIIVSWTPSKCGASCGLKCQVTPSLAMDWLIGSHLVFLAGTSVPRPRL